MNRILLATITALIFLWSGSAFAQPADAEVATFASPANTNFCPAQMPISINIYNNDLVDITEVVLDWTINGVSQLPVTWTGLLAAGDIVPIELVQSYDFQSGMVYDIQVTIQSVNTQPDPNNLNDVNLVSFNVNQVYLPIFYWNGCSLECLNYTDYLSITWYKDGVPDPNAPDSEIYTPSQNGNYTMVGLTFDSCDAVADTALFITPPNFNISALGVTAFCEGDSVGLVFTYSEQLFFTWSTGSNTDTIYANQDGWYSVTGTTVNSCPVADSIQVTVYPTPVLTISNVNDTLVSTYSGFHQWFYNGNSIGGAFDSIYVPTQSGMYYATATDVHGCTGTSNTINWIMPGIAVPVEPSNVMIYPNPAKDLLNIKYVDYRENLVLRIFDAMGRLVLEKEITSDQSIDISRFEEGVYQCVFTGEVHKSSQKLVKTF